MVDDSSADRKLYRILLAEQYGLNLDFQEAPNARLGLELCKSLPDCVLLDYSLPDMDGVAFLRRLGRGHIADLPEFAVVMLTGLGNEQVAMEAMRAGAQDYLVKDRVTPETLRLTIERATSKIGLLRDLQAERDRLAGLLAEKDALLEEVHHRVKNNLQVVASLLRLQAGAFGDERLSAALRETQNRVESMAFIHEQLYQARNLREVDLAVHTALVANHLMNAYGIDPVRVRCTLNLEELRVGVDRAIPTALIFNELMSNALKHAFPEGRSGKIEVIGRQRGDISIEVRDDGVGLAEGAGMESSRTLGLHIVRILTRQLHGEFLIDGGGERRSGTICRLTIPAEGASDASRQGSGKVTGKVV